MLPTEETPESNEPPMEAEIAFAGEVLAHLLHRIEVGNANAAAHPGGSHKPIIVSHAWIDGAAINLVYTAPPSGQIWGLHRDTRESLMDWRPWMDGSLDAATWYYVLDLAENWPGRYVQGPDDDPDAIAWSGDRRNESPFSELPDQHRYTSPPVDPAWIKPPAPEQEPRRYGNPI